MRPSWLSKLNTLVQIALVCVILAAQAAGLAWTMVVDGLIYVVLVTTVASGAHYLWTWTVLKQIEPASKEGRQ
jgi:cardiolipin synthase